MVILTDVTFSEREALKHLIIYIQQERDRLLDEYTKAVNRLSELDRIDNSIQHREENIEMSLEEAIDKHNKENGYLDVTDETTKNSIEYDGDREYYKDYDNKNNRVTKIPSKSSKYQDVRRVSQDVVSILKEKGTPIKTKDLIVEMSNRGIKTSSPYVLLNQIRRYQPRIERVDFGYYQYRW